MDLPDAERAWLFAIYAPILDVRLPPGHVSGISGTPHPWDGEPWDLAAHQTGSTSRPVAVAPDVYCELAKQSGIPIHYTP